jgi:hypothetical protein
MSEGILPFQYEAEKTSAGMTALAGLPLYMELFHLLDLRRMIEMCLPVEPGEQGWTHDQMITSLVLLHVAGGDCVDDLRILEGDEGLCRLIGEIELYGRTGSERRALKRRWRKARTRTVPSPTSTREYLDRFHDPGQEELRETHKAFIPRPSELLTALVLLNGAFAAAMQRRCPQSTATLDMDATLVETFKRAAEYCCWKYKAYQPLNVYWAEQGLMLFSEFRDGNVPAGFDLLRPFKQALDMVPDGVKKVYLRADSAAYVTELLQYCAQGTNERFGVIESAVGADVTQAFKEAVREVCGSHWHRLFRNVDGCLQDTGQQWAEVCFVPSSLSRKKDGPEYRFIAIREPLEQPAQPRVEEQMLLPFPTMDWGDVRYKLTGIVTNRTIPGDELIWWYRARCGKSEEAHSVMKEDLGGGKLPSQRFGANAAWWRIMVLAFNVNESMKRLVLGGSWVNRRMKAIRFALINLPGRVLKGGRHLFVRLTGGHSSNEILFEARRRMQCLWASG